MDSYETLLKYIHIHSYTSLTFNIDTWTAMKHTTSSLIHVTMTQG